MFLESVRVYRFRNLADQTVGFSPTFNVLVGDNGQGKTNFVEALSLLSSGKSFRSSDLSDLVRWNEDGASVFGRVHQGEESYELGIIVRDSSKEGLLDGQTLKTFSDFIGKLVAVTFTPNDLNLIKGPPQGRRTFIDRHIAESEPPMVKHFVAYQKALKNKAALLKEGRAESAQLYAWNQLLAAHGTKIVRARAQFLKQIEERARMILSDLVPQEAEIALGLVGDWRDLPSEAEALERLEAISSREIFAKACISGPHRDDVSVALSGNDARSFASQGQTRSLVLGLKLAVISYLEDVIATSPVVVLDDVESELDTQRRTALFEFLAQGERQVFITGTDVREAKELRASFFNVSDGLIKPV